MTVFDLAMLLMAGVSLYFVSRCQGRSARPARVETRRDDQERQS